MTYCTSTLILTNYGSMEWCVCMCVYILNHFLSTLLFLNILVIHIQDIPPPNTEDTVLLNPLS